MGSCRPGRTTLPSNHRVRSQPETGDRGVPDHRGPTTLGTGESRRLRPGDWGGSAPTPDVSSGTKVKDNPSQEDRGLEGPGADSEGRPRHLPDSIRRTSRPETGDRGSCTRCPGRGERPEPRGRQTSRSKLKEFASRSIFQETLPRDLPRMSRPQGFPLSLPP